MLTSDIIPYFIVIYTKILAAVFSRLVFEYLLLVHTSCHKATFQNQFAPEQKMIE